MTATYQVTCNMHIKLLYWWTTCVPHHLYILENIQYIASGILHFGTTENIRCSTGLYALFLYRRGGGRSVGGGMENEPHGEGEASDGAMGGRHCTCADNSRRCFASTFLPACQLLEPENILEQYGASCDVSECCHQTALLTPPPSGWPFSPPVPLVPSCVIATNRSTPCTHQLAADSTTTLAFSN